MADGIDKNRFEAKEIEVRLKEWEARHNAFVQFQTQFLSFVGLGATAFTVGLYYSFRIGGGAPRVFFVLLLVLIGVLFVGGNWLSRPILKAYRIRINHFADELRMPRQDEVKGIERAVVLAAAGGVVAVVIALASLFVQG